MRFLTVPSETQKATSPFGNYELWNGMSTSPNGA